MIKSDSYYVNALWTMMVKLDIMSHQRIYKIWLESEFVWRECVIHEVKMTEFSSVFQLWHLLKNLGLMNNRSINQSWADMQVMQKNAIDKRLKVANTRLWVDIG